MVGNSYISFEYVTKGSLMYILWEKVTFINYNKLLTILSRGWLLLLWIGTPLHKLHGYVQPLKLVKHACRNMVAMESQSR